VREAGDWSVQLCRELSVVDVAPICVLRLQRALGRQTGSKRFVCEGS
jgi:hypothetical protein